MANQVVRVRREAIESCMTCPICNKLFRDATTISECLHTFCRKCIYDKISDEEIENCPICNIDLGCVPLEKLRPDHNLQDLRAKVFPIKGGKAKAADNVASIILPVRRKERSLSSLVVSTPRVTAHSSMTGRRTKSITRKAVSRGTGFSVEKRVKKEDDSEEDHSESSSSPDNRDKFSENPRQKYVPAETSQSFSNRETENGAQKWEGKLDLWKPLDCLVEAANRTKSMKSNSHVSENKAESAQFLDNNHIRRRMKDNKWKLKAEEENSTDLVSSGNLKQKKLRRVRRKREVVNGGSRFSPQAVLDASNHERRFGPIWFSLIASEEQEGSQPLPQIRPTYLRIKDGNMPVSSIQKYLMAKLDLPSETEVEIKCMGQPVVPMLQMCSLVDLWLQTASTSERTPVTIGSSAKDLVMVLAYARKPLGDVSVTTPPQ